MNSAYSSTVFKCIPEMAPKEFYIITVWNPMGGTSSYSDNFDRDKKIERRISANDCFRIIGMSQDEQHAEPSWGVVCTEELALDIAAEFEQEAIFHVVNDQLSLVSVDGKFRQELGSWKDRIRDPRRIFSFDIHVGSRSDSAAISEVDRQMIIDLVKNNFSSFNIINSVGYFRSNIEESIIINISTDQPRQVLLLSHELRSHLAQEGIGVQCRGIYQRVTSWSDDQMLLDAWGV